MVIKLYDIFWNEVSILDNEEKPIGNYAANFYATGLSSGFIYSSLKLEVLLGQIR